MLTNNISLSIFKNIFSTEIKKSSRVIFDPDVSTTLKYNSYEKQKYIFSFSIYNRNKR